MLLGIVIFRKFVEYLLLGVTGFAGGSRYCFCFYRVSVEDSRIFFKLDFEFGFK